MELRDLGHHHGHALTSSLLGAYGSNPLAVDISALNVLLTSLAMQATLVS